MTLDVIRTQFFPLTLPAGVIARAVDRDTVFDINRATRIFNPDDLGLYSPPDERLADVKRITAQFAASGEEAFGLYNESGEAIGWFWGYMEDRESILIDTFGLIAPYRGQGIYQAFVRTLLAYLEAAGYERVTVHTHPNNRAMLIANLKAGFSIIGMELNATTGVLVKLAYDLHADRRADFAKGFRLLPEDKPEANLR
jgi:RimJ/RimL family protein N-acetyltransferase